MKRTIIQLAFLFLASIALFAANDIIESFTATSDGESITIKWRSISEENIETFVIERSADKSYFKAIHEEDANGTPSFYNYVDEEAFMKDVSSNFKKDNDRVLSGNNYKYRIKVIKEDNTFQYTEAIDIAHNTSSIRKTWGMMKEMFK